jgi:hypothetical protein
MIFFKDFSSALVIISSVSTILITTNLLLPTSASEIKNTFRQSFWVGNNAEEFNDFEVAVFETIYRGNTFQFAPDNEADKTATNCTVIRQQMLSLPEEEQEDEDQTNVLNIDFTMHYYSNDYNVKDHPRLFQNWTNQNLPTIQNQMNVLNLNVTSVGKASRIVVSTAEPSASAVNFADDDDFFPEKIPEPTAQDAVSTATPTIIGTDEENTEQPSLLLQVPSQIKNTFRQSFWVGNNEEFNDFEVKVFETIYRGNTFQFAPNNHEASKTVTNCTIFRQGIQYLTADNDAKEVVEVVVAEDRNSIMNSTTAATAAEIIGRDKDNVVALSIDFTMQYYSNDYNVKDYPRLFQNWTNQNLNTIRTQMNVLNLNVTHAGKAFRIVVSTSEPSAPTSEPSAPMSAPSAVSTATTPTIILTNNNNNDNNSSLLLDNDDMMSELENTTNVVIISKDNNNYNNNNNGSDNNGKNDDTMDEDNISNGKEEEEEVDFSSASSFLTASKQKTMLLFKVTVVSYIMLNTFIY